MEDDKRKHEFRKWEQFISETNPIAHTNQINVVKNVRFTGTVNRCFYRNEVQC